MCVHGYLELYGRNTFTYVKVYGTYHWILQASLNPGGNFRQPQILEWLRGLVGHTI